TASVSENNLFGSGKALSASVDNTRATTNFAVRYVNPYFTPEGVSRGFSVFSSKVDAAAADVAAYNSKTVGAGVFFGIPLSEDNRFDVGADVERIKLEVSSTTSQIAQDFVATHGADNTLYKTTLGWSYDTLDSAINPSTGSLQSVSGEIAVP